MRSLALAVAPFALALVAPLGSQTPTRTAPKVFTNHYAPSYLLGPLARTKMFQQTWYRGSDLRIPWPITEVGFRIEETAVAPAMQQSVEIVLTSTPATFGTLSKTFANNLGTDATVFFSLKTINLPAQNRPTDPNAPSLWLVGDRPFIFQGPHLIVQIDIQTTAAPVQNTYWSDGYSMGTVASTLHTTSGTTCGGAIAAAYVAATGSYDVSLSGATPNGAAILLLGRENTAIGGIPLPLDLTSIGMSGCALGVDPLIMAPMAADGQGRAMLSVPFALPTDSVVVHAQFAHTSTTTPAGLATTAVAHSILGGAGVSNYVYNWTTFGPVAQYGPYATNRGAVMLFKP